MPEEGSVVLIVLLLIRFKEIEALFQKSRYNHGFVLIYENTLFNEHQNRKSIWNTGFIVKNIK